MSVTPLLHISYSVVPVSQFAKPIALQIPLSPPLLSWPHRALRDNDLRMADILQTQHFLAQQAVNDAHPEPCLLSTAPLCDIPNVDFSVLAAIEERMRMGTTVELDPLTCIGPSFVTENSPKMYYDVALTRTLLQKALTKGRIILWPSGGPLPHFVSALSVAFRFVSGKQKRRFTQAVAHRHVAAQRLAKIDLQNSCDNSGVERPLNPLCGPELEFRDARLYHDTSHPVGNLNTRGLVDPERKVKYESLRIFLDLLRPGDALFKTDLSGAFPSLKNRVDELYTQGVAFEGRVYVEFAMSLGTRTGPDNYDSCLGNPLQALVHAKFRKLSLKASTTRWVDDFLGMISLAHHQPNLLEAAHQAFACVEQSAASMNAVLAEDKTIRPWVCDRSNVRTPNHRLTGALGFDIETHPLVVLIIPEEKLTDIRFEARRARMENSISKKDLESFYGKVSGIASALDGALPFASDLLSLIVECNRSNAKRAFPSASLRHDLGFFSDLADNMGRRIIVPSAIDIPRGHVEKDAATGSSTELGFISVHFCGHVLVFDPPGRTAYKIATQELMAATISSFCCAAVWPNMQIATTDDNANCISWLQSGHAGKVERNFMLRMRARAMMVANIREDHVPIASEANVLADSGTHLNEAKRFSGFVAYLSFLANSCRSKPSWWPGGFPYPPRATAFDRIDARTPLGVLAERVSFANPADLCFSREEVVSVLRAIRIQLLDIANSVAI
jgi:hypothetical protein